MGLAIAIAALLAPGRADAATINYVPGDLGAFATPFAFCNMEKHTLSSISLNAGPPSAYAFTTGVWIQADLWIKTNGQWRWYEMKQAFIPPGGSYWNGVLLAGSASNTARINFSTALRGATDQQFTVFVNLKWGLPGGYPWSGVSQVEADYTTQMPYRWTAPYPSYAKPTGTCHT